MRFANDPTMLSAKCLASVRLNVRLSVMAQLGTYQLLLWQIYLFRFRDIANNTVPLKATALVVPGNCPLLVSNRELTAMNAFLDCANGRVLINHQLRGPGGKHTIRCTKAPSGLWCKYLVPRASTDSVAAHATNQQPERRTSPRLQERYTIPTYNRFDSLQDSGDGFQGNGRGPRGRYYPRGHINHFAKSQNRPNFHNLPPIYDEMNYPPLQRV